MRDGMAKVSERIQTVKVFVDQAAKASPEASLVWAGVCVALPLLTNPHVASKANKDGFDYVTSHLAYYLEVEHLLWSEDEWKRPELAKLKKDPFCDSWVKLYKKMLEYQLNIAVGGRILSRTWFFLTTGGQW